jgi:tripartite ATP-independent transporter DctP family solute receptor
VNRRQFAAGTLGAFASISVVRAPARAATFSYKFSSDVAPEHPTNLRAKEIFSAIKEKTGGKLEIGVFPNNILGGASAVFGQLRAGAVQFMMALDGIVASVAPVAAIPGVGFAFKDTQQAFSAFDGPLGAYVTKEISAKGLYCYARPFLNGMREVTSSVKPIVTVGDLEGLKIRTPPNKLAVDLFRTLGASPTPMNFTELYTALQTHIVDAQENPVAIVEVARLYEVQKYLSLTNHMWSAEFLIGNGDAWTALGPDIQKICEDEFATYLTLERNDTAKLNDTLTAKLASRGMAVNAISDPAAFRAKLAPFYATWKGEFGQTAWDLLEQGAGTKLA